MTARLLSAEVRRELTRRALSVGRTKIGRHAARHGVLPTYWPQAMLRRLQPTYVIDVGANRGQFSLDVHTVLPHTPIIAFEPLQHEAAVYSAVFGAVPSVELRTHALGAEAGVQAMHVTRAADSSSLLAPTPLQNATFPDTDEIDQTNVTVSTLDNALAGFHLGKSPLLKADVQGYELEVLKGAPLTLRSLRWVYLELSFVQLYEAQPLAAEVISYLADHGFQIDDVVHVTRSVGRAVQADLLFSQTA